MRVRIYMTSGDRVDAEQFSTDKGTTWQDITVDAVAAAMDLETGYTVVLDVASGRWRSFRNARIESIGPAGELYEILDKAAQEFVQRRAALALPDVVIPNQPTP